MALAGGSAEHTRERLAQHLAALLERGVDEGEGRPPLGLGAGLGRALEADEHRVDVRHRPEHLRETWPAVRQRPYQAAFTLGAP